MSVNWSKIIDGLTIFMVGLILLIVLIGTAALLSFDTVVGAGSMLVFTNGDTGWATFISLATTGMATALAFMAYLAVKNGYQGAGIVFGLASLLVLIIDVYFDSLTADMLRYGVFVTTQTIAEADRVNHILFRVLIGGMSILGEPLAVAIIVGMPELKAFIQNVIPSSIRHTYQAPIEPVRRTPPASIPRSNSIRYGE